jgi:hypothetical protein
MVLVIKKGENKTLRQFFEKLKKQKKTNGIDTNKFCGIIKFKKDALVLQKEWRDEW